MTLRGGWYLFGFTALLELQPLFLIAIFYEVPKRFYGQFALMNTSFIVADPTNRTSILGTGTSMNDKQFKDLLRAGKEESEFLANDVSRKSPMMVRRTSMDGFADINASGNTGPPVPEIERKLSDEWLHDAPENQGNEEDEG